MPNNEERKTNEKEKKNKKEKRDIKEIRENVKKKLEDFRWTKKSVTIAIIVAAVIIGSITAAVLLSGRTDSNIITGDDGTKYKKVDEVSLSMTNVKTLNPCTSKDSDTYYLSKLVYDGLFRLNKDMVPENDLAKHYTIDKNANTITVDLVDTEFHNGSALTAKDVKYTVEALKAAGSNEYSSQVSEISYVETDGDSRVIIHFDSGGRMTLADLTFPILPRGQYDGVYSVIYKTDFKMIGTGKYKCKSYNSSTGMTLVPNENYHGDNKAENTITVSILAKSADKYKMTEASNISVAFTKSLGREAGISQKDTKIVDFPSNEVEYLGYNFTDENMAKKNIRKAIASAINCKAMIQECYYNSGMVNDNVFYPNYMGVDSSKDNYSYSQAKAEKYLKKEGYKDRDDDGFVEDENMGELSLTLLVSNTDTRRKMADMIQSDLEDAGIHVTLSYAEEKSLKNYLKAGNFDIFIAGLKYSDSVDMSEILKGTEYTVKYETDTGSSNSNSSNGDSRSNNSSSDSGTYEGSKNNSGSYSDSTTGNNNSSSNNSSLVKKKSYSTQITNSNYTRYYSAKVNKLLSKMNSGLTNDEMKETFTELKGELTDDLPYYCLLYKTYGMVKAPTLEGTVKPVFWDIYSGSEAWKSKYEITDSGR
ncbi:MAG: ABC transporter substrate-binding protein [Eubacteriaceae bacterium]|nr:ABC transporter substrate-binding protein [Eubacteriaceae bacterium]